MKSSIKLAFIISVAAIFVTAIFSANRVAVSAASSSSVSQKGVYNANCASCHGRDGKANTPKGRTTEADDLTDSSVKSMSDAKIARIIRNGKGEMPGFAKKMTAAQITAVVAYVKKL